MSWQRELYHLVVLDRIHRWRFRLACWLLPGEIPPPPYFPPSDLLRP